MRKAILVTCDFGDNEDDDSPADEAFLDFLEKLDMDHRVVSYDVTDIWSDDA